MKAMVPYIARLAFGRYVEAGHARGKVVISV